MNLRLQLFSTAPGHAQLATLVGFSLLLAGTLLADAPAGHDSPENEMLPLPRWTDSEVQTFRQSALFPGEGLLPSTGQPLPDFTGLQKPETGPQLQELFTRTPDLPSRLKPEEMRLFLPEALLGRSPPQIAAHDLAPTPVSALQGITPEFIALCEQTPPEEFLIDPQVNLPEIQAQAMREFLKFHAHDARIQLHVLVLPKDKTWPDSLHFDRIASGSLLAKESCLLVYPLSEPWRAQVFLTRSIHGHASDAFLNETLQACVTSALQTTDAQDQLHRYVVELSTRLFWLQKALAGRADTESADDKDLTSVTHGREKAGSSISITSATLVLGGAFVMTAVVLLAIWFGTKRMRKGSTKFVWYFPEPETIPRLGGAFTGGGGGVIRY
jgi:hypothetical protein